MKGIRVRVRIAVTLPLVALIFGACGSAVVSAVRDGTYAALVPTAEQYEAPSAVDIPGGFTLLRASAVDQVELSVAGDIVTFRVDGADAGSRIVVERLNVVDREGSGPFKGQREVLILGESPLDLGALRIESPAIWQGGFAESPVVTLKTWDPGERGPAISCGPDESCLLLTSGVDPIGHYANANDPALGQNPITSIEIFEAIIEFALDSGQVVRTDRVDTPIIGCGLAATASWDVSEAVGLEFDDPVLIHTLCPAVSGASIQLVIMERDAVPVLASLSEATDGEWCQASPACLWFVPE